MKDFTLESPIEGFEVDESLSELTVPEYLLQKANQWTDSNNGRTHFITDVVTGDFNDFSTFEEQTRKLASALYKRGMRKFDTAIFMTYDMVNLHLFFVGVWRANGMVRATYPEDDFETLLSRVEESRVGWIVCDPETAKMCLSVAEQIYWGVEVIVVGEYEGCISFSSLFEDDGDEIPALQITADDAAMILCTSGTTGKSKGAVHSHRNILAMLEGLSRFFPLAHESSNLIVSKGTHISGSLFPMASFAAGATVLVMATITKENLFRAVDLYKPGMVWGFPTFLLALVNDPDASNYDFSSIEIAASGGSPVTPAIEQALIQLPNIKFVVNAYGLTEIVPISVSVNYDGDQSKPADSPPFTTGKVFPGVSVQIRAYGMDEPLGPNQRGEICVKSMYLFKGYYKNEEATNDAIQDGWFKTGDVGYYDENGFLFLVDRMKEIFKYYNNHISPTELEEVIEQHSAVAECCVVGVIDPDGGDRIPRAFVTLKEGPDSFPPEEIRNFADEKLPDYKRLRGGLYVLSELPKGKTGKITRQLVAALEVNEE